MSRPNPTKFAQPNAKTMNRLTNALRLVARAALIAGLVTGPLLVVSHVNAGDKVIIEAPSQKKMGAGLVLLVSLQRAYVLSIRLNA